jgi:hypothetical protein
MPQLRINAIDRSSRCVSHAERHGHLDATAGREVVYCHACVAEWYRDENGLTCPECHGEITEIVGFPLLPLDIQNVNRGIQIDPANDPRDFDHHSSASASPEHHPYDSDPEEADIDEHTQHGFAFRRSVRDGPDHHHHDPAIAPTFERFFDMLNGFGPRAPGGNGSFPSSPGEREQPPEPNFGPRIYRTTFTSGTFGGGTTSVTIVSGPIHATRSGPAGPPQTCVFGYDISISTVLSGYIDTDIYRYRYNSLPLKWISRLIST